MSDSTIQMLEGLFASPGAVEDGSGSTVAAPLSSTVSPSAQPVQGARRSPSVLTLGAGAVLLYFLFHKSSRNPW